MFVYMEVSNKPSSRSAVMEGFQKWHLNSLTHQIKSCPILKFPLSVCSDLVLCLWLQMRYFYVPIAIYCNEFSTETQVPSQPRFLTIEWIREDFRPGFRGRAIVNVSWDQPQGGSIDNDLKVLCFTLILSQFLSLHHIKQGVNNQEAIPYTYCRNLCEIQKYKSHTVT